MYKEGIYHLHVSNIENAELKQILSLYQIDEISIQYWKVLDVIPTPINRNDLNNFYDSTITMSWNKSMDDKFVYENLIYIFSTYKSTRIANRGEKQLNDSLWLQKLVSDVVIVH